MIVSVDYPFLSNLLDMDGMEDAQSTPEPNWSDSRSSKVSNAIKSMHIMFIDKFLAANKLFSSCPHPGVFVDMILLFE